MGAILVAVGLGLIVGLIAVSKGRSFFLWWIYGALALPAALPHILMLPRMYDDDHPPESMKRCQSCAEWIHIKASVCPYCQRDPGQAPRKEKVVEGEVLRTKEHDDR